MKSFILFIMLTVATVVFGQTPTNGVFIKDGITVEVDKKVQEVNAPTKPETLYFSNELIVRVYTNSSFCVSSFFQEVFDIDKSPRKAKFGVSSFAGSLMNGSITAVYTGTNDCIISTPMTDIELGKGTFYFVVKESRVIVFVLDGSLTAHGDKKKQTVVTTGYALIAMPNDVGILEDKISLGAEKVRVDTIKKLTDDAQDIVNLQGKFLFITINGKTIGIDIN